MLRTQGRLRGRPMVSAVAVFLGTVFLAGCGAKEPQSFLDPQGPVAKAQYGLFSLTFWIAVVIFAVVAGLSIYIIMRFREKPGSTEIPKQIHGDHRLEVIWTIIPIVILTIIAVPTVRNAFYVASAPADSDPLEVRVVGHQWWWEFQYPKLGIVTANELHIPAGRPVTLTLNSADVIHSFWVPKLAGKTDVIPGRDNTMWIQADKPGYFYGQCGEYCGDSHANMRLRVIAEEPQEFAAWITDFKALPALAEDAPDLAKQGEQYFMNNACIACHTVDGTLAKGEVGPNLTHFAQRTTMAAGTLDNTPKNMARWLRNPQAVKAGALMPNLHLSDDAIDKLVAYLQYLK